MNIHRCRFVEHQPAGIQHVAVTPCFYPNPRVAVARANGDIELWNTTTRLTPAQLSVSTGNSAKPEDAAATTHAAAPQLDGDIARKSWEIRRMDPPSWHSLGRITPAPGESGESSHIEALAWSVALSSSAGEISSDDDDDSDADSDAEMQGHGRTGDKHTATSTAMRPRLFAASLHGHITEYDVDTLSAVARVDSVGGGAVWCLAVTPCQRYLLAGCEDGRVRVYDISGPAGYVEYMRGFDRQNGRIVCVAVGTTLSADGDEITTVLTGGNDGQVLKWDLATGRNTGRMSVGRSRRQDDEVLVWDIAILNNDTLASCDSQGYVKVWDARTCTLLQSFNSHDNDVLSIAANHDGSIMYAAGMDGKIVMFNHVRAVTDEFTMDNGAQDNISSLKQWAMTHNRRFHTHDVRSLVLLEWLDIAPPMQQSSKSLKRGRNGVASASAQQASGFSGRVIMDHLISGGVDTQLSVLAHPSDRFPRAIMQPVRLSPFPKQPMTHICAEKRLLLTQDNDKLALWRLGNALEVTTGTATEAIGTQEQTAAAPKVPTAELLPLQTGPEFLLELRVRDGMHVLCSDISSDGQWIAACDATRVHLFQIKYRNDDTQTMQVVNMSDRLPSVPSCSRLAFVVGDALALVGLNGIVMHVRLKSGSKQFTATPICHDGRVETLASSTLPVHISVGGGFYGRKFLVVVDSANRVDVHDMDKREWYCQIPISVDAGLVTSVTIAPRMREFPSSKSDAPIDHDAVLIAQALPVTAASKRAEQPTTCIRAFSLRRNRFLFDIEDVINCVPWLATRKDGVLGMTVSKEAPSSKPDGERTDVVYLWTNHWMARLEMAKIRRGLRKFQRMFPHFHKNAKKKLRISSMRAVPLALDERLVAPAQRALFAEATQGIDEGVAVTHRFQNILHFGFVGAQGKRKGTVESVVVERPWNAILEQLPAPIDVKSYGQ